jgi:hypothetical protein
LLLTGAVAIWELLVGILEDKTFEPTQHQSIPSKPTSRAMLGASTVTRGKLHQVLCGSRFRLPGH